jgi:methylamine---glutamate N-methyltransferase subunit A
MCGVVGLLTKDPALEPQLGTLLVPMLAALSDRGPDSSGIAVYSDQDPAGGPPATAGTHLRISLGSDTPLDWAAVAAGLSGPVTRSGQVTPSGQVTRSGEVTVHLFDAGAVLTVPASRAGEVVGRLRAEWPAVRVIGTGRSVTVIKDTGRAEDTCRRYGVESWQGHLAIAHTRMATESAVTVLHSHPFVPAPDLCVVHNGSFSNYATVRRRLQADGVTFDSDNDSEVAARFLAARLAAGDDLAEATRWVMKEMDGFFTLVIATDGQMSVVRDAFACKPAVIAETDRYVAVGSEYRALAALPGIGTARVFEPQPEEVYTWSR